MRQPERSFRIGLAWGIGHAAGTITIALPVLSLSRFVHLPTLAQWGDRFAGFALLTAALLAWRAWARADAATAMMLAAGVVGAYWLVA